VPRRPQLLQLGALQNACRTGAQLLWRVKSDIGVPHERTLSDGLYMTSIHALKNRRARPPSRRTIELLDDPGLPETDQRYRLLSTILDPQATPAPELAAR
jgi:hypothetical protein